MQTTLIDSKPSQRKHKHSNNLHTKNPHSHSHSHPHCTHTHTRPKPPQPHTTPSPLHPDIPQPRKTSPHSIQIPVPTPRYPPLSPSPPALTFPNQPALAHQSTLPLHLPISPRHPISPKAPRSHPIHDSDSPYPHRKPKTPSETEITPRYALSTHRSTDACGAPDKNSPRRERSDPCVDTDSRIPKTPPPTHTHVYI